MHASHASHAIRTIRVLAALAAPFTPCALFPMSIFTYPIERRLKYPYVALSIAALWYAPAAYIAPALLVPGSNGAFYIDHMLLCCLAYIALISPYTRTPLAIALALKNPHTHKHMYLTI